MQGMLLFMGFFFIIVAVLKVGDWKGFVEAFMQYDIIGNRSKVYASLYPIFEFILGMMFISAYHFRLAALIVIALMVISMIGALQALKTKKKIHCACLGTMLNIPLTKFTVIESLIMISMSLIILA